MKNLIFRKNIIAKKKAGGAMIVLMLVFFVIFILAFGSGYLVFMNTSKSVDVSNGIKARYAALAGKDRALYEAIKNNYDFAGNCSSNIFQKTLADGSSYIISCVDNSGDKSFFSTGKYKNVEISLEIDCINIEKECSDSCKTGSICGGGKLLKTDTYALSISPSGCDASGANCSNTFSTADTVNFQWDTTVPDPFVCGNTLSDSRDSQQYSTVQIGTQCWFAENLAYLPSVQTNANFVSYGNAATPAYGVYGYTGTDVATAKATANYQTYGVLYNWYAAVATSSTTGTEGLQGACPTGWHIPTSAEQTTLYNTINNNVIYRCNGTNGAIGKAVSSASGWTSDSNVCAIGNNQQTNNSTGFNVLPAGDRDSDNGTFGYLGTFTNFWSSSFSGSNVSTYYLYYVLNGFYSTTDSPVRGLSVRCIKDSSSGGTIAYKGASNVDNGKTNITTLVPQTNTYLEAAKYCDDLVANGYSDWYLPATNELAALRSDSAFSYFNLQSVSGDDYWVSTEQGSTTPTMAGYIKMSTGVASNADKGSEFKVRCVRKDTSCSSKTICGSACDYGGEEYETIQIGSQCWFKRNLNIGTMINSNVAQSNNSTIEKYCYINNSSNCATYGGLYQWNEAMQYLTSDGAQGLCPSGWHLPKDSDWTNLTNYLSANSQYWCSATSVYLAKSLSSVSGWNASASSCMPGNLPENNNSTGFSAIPGGYFYGSGWGNLGVENYLWTSTTDSANAWWRSIGNSNQRVSRLSVAKNYALTIRCLKD